MNDPENDLYAVLGVVPDAEFVVIQAAYRALSSKYHPDRWQGTAGEAHAKMVAINRAWETLKDPARRAEYEKTRPKGRSRFGTESDYDDAFEEAFAAYQDRWNVAVGVFPHLEALRTRLAKTSYQLALGFVAALLETKKFAVAEQIAQVMEAQFLERYFGTDSKVIAYARLLIRLGEKGAVRRLNQLVDVLGSEVDASAIIDVVEREFRIAERERQRRSHDAQAQSERCSQDQESWRATRQANFSAERAKRLRRIFELSSKAKDAQELAYELGYTVDVIDAGFLRGYRYEVARNQQTYKLASESEFVRWAHVHLVPA